MLDFRTILFIVLALLGVWLFRRGWSGRRVDNHPWCRACRFDLRGRWPGAEKCPECGAVLEAVGAVEIGQRRRRPAALGLGLLLLIGCAVWLGFDVWKAAGPIDWMAYKPDWWVARDARSADAERAEAALKELNARIERDAISEVRLADLVAYALELQADELATWREGWGDVIQAAWAKGSLTQEQILQYAQRAVDIQMETESPMVRRWELTRAGPRPTLLRAGSGELSLLLTPVEAVLGDSDLELNPEESASYGTLRSTNVMLPAKNFAVLAEPGEHELKITWRATLSPRNTPAAPAVWDVLLTAPLTVLDPAPGTQELIIDAEVTAALQSSIEVQAIGLRVPPRVMGDNFSGSPVGGRIVVILTLREAPIAGYLQIHAGDPPRSRAFGQGQMQLQATRLSSYQARLFIQTLDGNEPGQISIVIRPDAGHAPGFGRARPGSEQIWYGKPIEFNDIPVEWFDTADDPGLSEALRAVVMSPQGYDPLPGTFERGTIQRGLFDRP